MAEEEIPQEKIIMGVDPGAPSGDKSIVPPLPPAENKTNPEDLIAKATAAAIRLEEANKEMSAILVKQERFKVEQTLGGKSTAGTPQISKEAKANAEARKFLKGTGYDDELFPEK